MVYRGELKVSGLEKLSIFAVYFFWWEFQKGMQMLDFKIIFDCNIICRMVIEL